LYLAGESLPINRVLAGWTFGCIFRKEEDIPLAGKSIGFGKLITGSKQLNSDIDSCGTFQPSAIDAPESQRQTVKEVTCNGLLIGGYLK
jgi:hypothetical protein